MARQARSYDDNMSRETMRQAHVKNPRMRRIPKHGGNQQARRGDYARTAIPKGV